MVSGADVVLDVRDIGVRFGGLVALSQVSLIVRRHEVLGLIGPNGAGKSTFINAVTGLYRITSGEIRLEDRRIDGLDSRAIAVAGVSRTFQNLRLFRSMTVLENVLTGFHAGTRSGFIRCMLGAPRQRREEAFTRAAALELLEKLDLAEHKDHLVGSLPYAQQKAVELCRALALTPKLLLLDEPSGGMSLAERQHLRNTIQALAKEGMTVLLIEHDVQLVMDTCHRIAVMDQGRKIADGSPEAIRNDEKVIAAYLGQED